jgi:hypothetical protein
MPLLDTGTILVLTPLSGFASLQLAPYSARGLTQTLELIKTRDSWLRRDVNGVLRNLADTRFQKYRSTITCKDGDTPCLDDAWIGLSVEVACALELSYPTGGSPKRPVVPSSQRTQGGITYYRPLLQMMVEDIRIALPEWQALYDWQIDLLEI